ncbi:restriction endonuclease subunit S [Ligilactobacillus murinus]|uniref:restriction endonuclease subunit S n=1 Tax=Ligilactobacillus murinus TaxID=1622 RepID=UPI0038641FD6
MSNGLEKYPKLRFPGFEEPYRALCLGNIATSVNRTDPESMANIMMLSAGKGFIMQSDKYSRDNAGQSLKKYILLKKGELAYNHGASKAKQYGCCYELLEDEARIPYVYHCFKIDEKEFTPYVALELNNPKMDKQLKRLVSSSARMDGLLNISFDDYMSVRLTLPSYFEQMKIADFLNTIDRRIELQRALVESLKKYKRGLSDKIFSTIVITSNCKKISWKNVFLPLQNNTFSRDDLIQYGGTVRDIHYGDILVKYGATVNLSSVDVPCIKPEKDISKFSINSYLQNGDIVIADTAEDYSVGKATEIIGSNGIMALSGLHTIPCRPCIEFVPMYLGYYLNSSYFRKQIYPMVQGTKVSSISKSEIAKTEILVPSQLEQQRVASILYGLDQKIGYEENQINALVHIKSAFLQQLFI